MYRCTECGKKLGSRKQARDHAKMVHFMKGKRKDLPTAEAKYLPSEISECYKRV